VHPLLPQSPRARESLKNISEIFSDAEPTTFWLDFISQFIFAVYPRFENNSQPYTLRNRAAANPIAKTAPHRDYEASEPWLRLVCKEVSIVRFNKLLDVCPPDLTRCAVVFPLHEAMHCPEIVDGLIHRQGAGPNSLDEYTGHRRIKLGAFFSIAANLPIETFEVDPITRFHHRAIQHPRQFFVSHPNLRHGHPFREPGNHSQPG
jgi:hypothetical protein